MKRFLAIALVFTLTFLGGNVFAQKKPTYKSNGTTYISGETYKTTGQPKVERSSSEKEKFLKSQGYSKEPKGYQVDHIVPLSKGGRDVPSNMQLIPTGQHKIKTANERANNSNATYLKPSYKSNSTYRSSNNYSAPSSTYKSNKPIYSGSKGGQYYYNSNGNKTHLRKK